MAVFVAHLRLPEISGEQLSGIAAQAWHSQAFICKTWTFAVARSVMRLPIRPVLLWSIPAILLAALTNGLYNSLPAEPRWVARHPGEILAVRPEGILLSRQNGPSSKAPARLLDPQTGQVRHEFHANITDRDEIDFSPDGRRIMTVTRRDDITEVHLIDLVSGSERPVPYRGNLRSILFSPDGELLALQPDEVVVELRDARTGQLLDTVSREDHVDDLRQGFAFTPGGEYLLCAGQRWIDRPTTYSVRAWDLRAKRWAFELPDTELQFFFS